MGSDKKRSQPDAGNMVCCGRITNVTGAYFRVAWEYPAAKAAELTESGRTESIRKA